LTAAIKRFIHHEAYSFEHFDHQTMGITAQLLKRFEMREIILFKLFVGWLTRSVL
jgi:hypothetical protein